MDYGPGAGRRAHRDLPSTLRPDDHGRTCPDGPWRPARGKRNILNIKRLRKWMTLHFAVETNIRGPYKLYWKVRNSGDEARLAGDLRGNIFDGTPEIVHTETTKYRGAHVIECFLVVNGQAVAYDRHPVTVE